MERYETPRVEQELLRRGIGTSRWRVVQLRRELGLRAKAAKKFERTTDSTHPRPVAPNRVERRFATSTANRVWVCDITYLWSTREGWLELAVVEDTYWRRIVGWSVSYRLKRDLGVKTLENALAGRDPCPGLFHHSDRGSQCASLDYR